MMKVIKYLLIVIVSLIAVLLAFAAFLPSEFDIKRSVEINKPAYIVYDRIAKFSNWADWASWREYDLDAKYTFGGVDGEIGSTMHWDGDTVGVGEMKMVKLEEFKLIEAELRFIKPMEMKSTNYFILEEKDGKTQLTMGDRGTLSYPMGKLFAFFMNLDKRMGPDFQKGIDKIKKLVESGIKISVMEKPEINILYISSTTSMDPREIQAKMGSAFGEIGKFIGENKIECSGPPIAITTAYDNSSYTFDAAFPVKSNNMALTGRIKAGSLPGGKYVKGIHIGPYDGLKESYMTLMEYLNKNKLTPSGRSYEEYFNDPGTTKVQKLITNIYFPVK